MHADKPILAACIFLLGACAQGAPGPATEPALVLGDPLATTGQGHASPLVAHLPAATTAADGEDGDAIQAFYLSRDFTPIWYDDGPFAGARARATTALADAGVAPAELSPEATAAQRAAHDVALTRAALRYDAAPPDDAAPGPVALFDTLAAAVAASTPPTGSPADTVFGGHARGIAAHEAIVAAGGWPRVPGGETLEPGARDPRVAALRARLRVSGDYQGGDEAGDVYTPSLVAAVEAFQARHGLDADGAVGPATRRALNVSAEARLAQLRHAQARADALLPRLGERYVLVNLPAFELRYVRQGEVHFATDVIVGSRKDPTVEFSDEIEHLVFNPYWNVPYSIASEELLPEFRADARGMAGRGYQVVDAGGTVISPTAVDWSRVSAAGLPYRVRQGPGRDNALGQVKFMFPNEHAIYLHDTPSKRLFDRSMRALSHGCIRVRDPLALAERLLEVDGIDRSTIDGWVADGYNHHVRLAEPVPVHLVYVTAWVDPDGTVHFREDIYGRERVRGSTS